MFGVNDKKGCILRGFLLMITTISVYQWYYTHPIDNINRPNHLKLYVSNFVSSYSIIRINGRQNS